MSDEPIWKSAVRAVWSNRWARALIFVAAALEIYIALLLPAIQGTIAVRKLQYDTNSSHAEMLAKTATMDLTPSPLNDVIGRGKDTRWPDTERRIEAIRYLDKRERQIRATGGDNTDLDLSRLKRQRDEYGIGEDEH